MNTDIKRKGGEKKTLKMEEQTLVAFGIILFFFFDDAVVEETIGSLRKDYVDGSENVI